MEVLVVDDHPIIHETLRAVLRSVRPEAQVRSQFDLAGALFHARRTRDLRLVLLDPGLPGCSGLDALVRFRKEFPEPRVAVISADAEPEIIRAAMAAGAVGYLPKTLQPKAIAEALRRILDGGTYFPPQAA
jgi:DNA-binding NarL/FixJ family response regulator